MFADVMFPISSYQMFTYSIPEKLGVKVKVGLRVKAPMGKREVQGIIVAIKKEPGFKGKTRPITSLVDETPILDPPLWKLVNWISHYYHTPVGQVAKTVLPQKLSLKYEPKKRFLVKLVENIQEKPSRAPAQAKIFEYLQTKQAIPVASLGDIVSNPMPICRAMAEKGFVELIEENEIPDLGGIAFDSVHKKIQFSDEQLGVLEELSKPLEAKEYKAFLLHGVTGSGKTEIYIEIIRRAIVRGKTAILLLPEISLTPQIAGRFRSEFGDQVALWHSKLTHAARAWTWKTICEGGFKIVIGARSAVFAPLKNLGVIIVDEEQENSFKQEAPAPRYHARDVALMRGKLHNAVSILASATPSLESYYNFNNEKLKLLRLTKRFGKSQYPDVIVVDMAKEEEESGKTGQLFSGLLLDKITQRLAAGEQIILLQNRRGYSPVLKCKDCGDVVRCPHCQISLAYHKVGNRMQCHFCGHTLYQVPQECDNCMGHEMQLTGAGTQKIEDQLKSFFPKARTIRVDHDTARSGTALTSLLKNFAKGEADILLGTQMIAKGLDFGNVTLVGIINGDTGLYLPDFRAGERVFQLIYQAAGRAGRREKQGEVIVQTFQPDNSIIRAASRLNVDEFYSIALSEREELGYPPFSWMAKIEINGKNKVDVYDKANDIKNKFKKGPTGMEIRGPVPCYWEKLSDRYRQMIVLTSEKSTDPGGVKLHSFIRKHLTGSALSHPKKGVSVVLDINPASLL